MAEKQRKSSKKKMPRGKPFPKGVSGNPAGRPTLENTFSDTVREMLAATEIDVTFTNGQGESKNLKVTSDKNMHYGIGAALIIEALGGDSRAAGMLIDRIEGKPKQSMELTGGGVLVVEEVVVERKD